MTIEHKAMTRSERKVIAISHIDPKLRMLVKMYAVANDIPVYRAFEVLLTLGLAAVKNNPEYSDYKNMDLIIVARNKQ